MWYVSSPWHCPGCFEDFSWVFRFISRNALLKETHKCKLKRNAVPVTLTACFGIFQPWALQQGLVKGLLNWWPQQHWGRSKAVQWKPESKGTLLAIWMYPMLNLQWTKEDLRYLSQWNHGQTFSMEPVRAQNSAPRKRQWLPNLKESLLVRSSIIFRAK